MQSGWLTYPGWKGAARPFDRRRRNMWHFPPFFFLHGNTLIFHSHKNKARYTTTTVKNNISVRKNVSHHKVSEPLLLLYQSKRSARCRSHSACVGLAAVAVTATTIKSAFAAISRLSLTIQQHHACMVHTTRMSHQFIAKRCSSKQQQQIC